MPSGRLIQRSYANKTKDEYYFEAYDDSLIGEGVSAIRRATRPPAGASFMAAEALARMCS